MNTFRLTYDGRVTIGTIKKTSLQHSVPAKTPHQEYCELVFSVHGFAEALRLQRHLGLSNVSNSTKEPESAPGRKRGQGGLTSHGRRLVRSAAAWLHDHSAHRTLSFLTCTIPTEADGQLVSENWAKIVKLLVQRLVYRLKAAGLPHHIVGVTELQSKRLKSVRDGRALHLHLVFVGKHRGQDWAIQPEDVDKIWAGILSTAVGYEGHCHQACKIETVKKSCVGYLGKYMSKGLPRDLDYSPEILPTAWYICTLDLRRMVKRMEVYFTGDKVDTLYRYIRGIDALWDFTRFIPLLTPEGRVIPIGFSGQLKGKKEIHELLRCVADLKDFGYAYVCL